MFDKHYDPYDVLMELQERLSTLERAHNNLAHAFEASEQELNQTLEMLRTLQQYHLRLRREHDQLKQSLRQP